MEELPIAAHVFPRNHGMVVGVLTGIGIGFLNAYLGVELGSWTSIVFLLLASIATVLILHEGIHGGVAWVLGHKPHFGIEPPLVFTTFEQRLPKNHFILVAIAPLILLDAVLITMYVQDIFPAFSNLCFAVNTIGAIGDVWITATLIRYPAEIFVQDTKSGVEIWTTASDSG